MTNFMLVRTSFGAKKRKHYSRVLKQEHNLTNRKIPTIRESILYSPEANLEDGEWFRMEKIKASGIINEIIDKPFNQQKYNLITKEEFEYMHHMVIVQNENAYFQKISTKHLISAPVVMFNSKPSIKKTNKMLILDDKFDAIYNFSSDTLYFKKYNALTAIFDGVTEYYKEATDEVVKKFLENDFLEIHGTFDECKVSKPNRKRVGLLVDKMDSFSVPEKQIIADYIVDYIEDMKKTDDGNKLIINNDEDLKHVLMGYLERYFTTIITNEAKLATGVMPI